MLIDNNAIEDDLNETKQILPTNYILFWVVAVNSFVF